MKKLLIKTGIVLLMISAIITSCKKKEIPNTTPQVSTTGMSAVTGTTATGGGNISDDGGAAVTISGLCYSKTNQTPTISDDTTKTMTTSSSFSSMLKNLQPSATYYVRAYATNSIGTGYGAVVSFTTGNGAPTATGVSITGTARVGEELTAAYTYSDPENNPQSGTTFQWYIATAATGTGEAAITGATTSKYKVKTTDEFKFIRVSITPKSSAGTVNGGEVKSAYVGPMEVEAVTFTYNGQQVTYGIITSSITGRKWMDRNLGATKMASNAQDYLAYGHLFVWGRLADGHQLTVSTGPFTMSAVNGTTDTQFTQNVPNSVLFFRDFSGAVVDWISPSNNDLWQAPTYLNNPCPDGWHIPTQAEWEAEVQSAVSNLKLTAAGFRYNGGGAAGEIYGGTGDYYNQGTGGFGYYWTSTVSSVPGWARYYGFGVSSNGEIEKPFEYQVINFRNMGYSCRCIKNL